MFQAKARKSTGISGDSKSVKYACRNRLVLKSKKYERWGCQGIENRYHNSLYHLHRTASDSTAFSHA